MARVTVEDCLHGVENLFQLVLVASRRARQIYAGSDIRVDEDGDKPTVIALREIADGLTGPEVLDQKVIPEMEMSEPELPLDSEVPPPAES
jgi:DNA-directed RNA polymerase subunit omega